MPISIQIGQFFRVRGDLWKIWSLWKKTSLKSVKRRQIFLQCYLLEKIIWDPNTPLWFLQIPIRLFKFEVCSLCDFQFLEIGSGQSLLPLIGLDLFIKWDVLQDYSNNVLLFQQAAIMHRFERISERVDAKYQIGSGQLENLDDRIAKEIIPS